MCSQLRRARICACYSPHCAYFGSWKKREHLNSNQVNWFIASLINKYYRQKRPLSINDIWFYGVVQKDPQKSGIRRFLDSIYYYWSIKSITEMTVFCMRNLFARTRLLLVFLWIWLLFLTLTNWNDFLQGFHAPKFTIFLWVFIIPVW